MGWLNRLFGKTKNRKETDIPPASIVTRPVAPVSTVPEEVPIMLPPKAPATGNASVPRAGANIAVDLGTSASAVATAIHAGGPPYFVHFGTLGEVDARLEDRVPLIGSNLVGPLDTPDGAGVGYILGRTGRAWLTWLREQRQNDYLSARYYASVKRMLDVSDRLDTVRYSLGGVFRELLLLALCPAHSGTVRARYLMEHGRHDWTTPVDPQHLEEFASERQLGFPPAVRRYLAETIRRAGLDLYVTVPNAFALGEVGLMVRAARKAAADAIAAWGIRRSGLPAVHVLREAEAVACWHHHCLRVETSQVAPTSQPTAGHDDAQRDPVPEPTKVADDDAYWLVFDMGAGTTDLALVQVKERGYRLLHRAGLPIGGDDVDLLFIRQLAHQPIRQYFEEIATGTRAVSFDEVAEHLRQVASTREDKGRTPGTLEGPPWERLEDTLFLQGLNQRHRLALKRLAQECKVAWSQAMRRSGGLADGFLDRIFAFSPAAPDLADFPEFEALGQYLLQLPGYRLLVHLATRGCCQALLERTGSLPRPVSRVVLSGRAARLPLIAEALSRALEEAGYARPGATTYQWPPAGRDPNRPAGEVDGKLAVVRGAAWYGFRRWRHDLPRGVGNDIVLQTFLSSDGESTLLFRQGEPLGAEGTARRVVGFQIPDQRLEEPFRFRIYNQRLPESMVDALAARCPDLLESLLNSSVCRRTLADGFRPRVSHRLGVEIDEARRSLALFGPHAHDNLRRLESGVTAMPAAQHPITGLPEDWLWEGEGERPERPGTTRRIP